MCTSSVSNVIYHKFSHGAAFYTLNGKNVNVMLELQLAVIISNIYLKVISCINKRLKFGYIFNFSLDFKGNFRGSENTLKYQ